MRRGTLPAGQLSLVFKWLPVGGKGVFEITVEIIRLGENAEPKTALRYKSAASAPGRAQNRKQGSVSCSRSFNVLHRLPA